MRGYSSYFPLGLLRGFYHLVFACGFGCAYPVKFYRRKGYNFKKVVIVGAGKNGMELYHVMKDDLSYGFSVKGFFDDNDSLKYVLPNYLGQRRARWKRMCRSMISMRFIVPCRVRTMKDCAAFEFRREGDGAILYCA